jgi:hypothetical protein
MSVFPSNPTGLAGEVAPTGFFDPAGLSNGKDAATLKQWREAEIKHGRAAMLAAAGAIAGGEEDLAERPSGGEPPPRQEGKEENLPLWPAQPSADAAGTPKEAAPAAPAVRQDEEEGQSAVEHAAARDVPAEQTLQAEHDVALAADQLVPATQLEQTASAVAEQLEERNLPAAQPEGKEHAEHGA